jgi:drug/metabolite transporter (DMT)-like permease
MVFPAVILSIGGIFLMGGGMFAALSWGDGLALLAAFFYALWAVLLGALLIRFPHPFLITAASFALAAAGGMAGSALGFDGPGRAITLAALAGAAPELAYLGLLSTGIAYTLQVVAQKHTTATCAMIIVSAEAIFGAVTANIILGETLTLMGWIGAGMVTAGILLVALSDDFPRKKRIPLPPLAPGARESAAEFERTLALLRNAGAPAANLNDPPSPRIPAERAG